MGPNPFSSMHRLVRLSHSARLGRAASSLASPPVGGSQPGVSTQNHSLWMTGLAATAASLFTYNQYQYSSCQVAAVEESTTSPAPEEEEEEEEEDPYANLPEEDEETDCSMCNTFRKGPCRPQWRKLERCFKDHEGQDNGAVKCMRYFKPHSACIMEFTNLYQLISLELKQELVRDAELAITQEERRTWDPEVDWSLLKRFFAEAGASFCETVRSRDEEGKPLPLWQRLPENKEPVLLTIPAPLPKVDPESGLILKIAYAVDGDSMLLNLTFNKEYGELLSQAEAKAEGKEVEAKPESEEPKEENKSDQFDFDFFVLPGDTKKVCICALYSEDPTKAGPEKEILDALLFKSKTYVLKDVVN